MGKTRMSEYYDEERGPLMEEALQPAYFEPAVVPILVPKICPEDVDGCIRMAAQLLWVSPSAAGNALRTALECLLSHKKVPKRKRDKSGKLTDLSLHHRIDQFLQKDPRVGEILLAIKWLGNVGSHSNELTKSDVLDAFELLEHALEEMFLKKTSKLQKLTKKIIERKGPAVSRTQKRKR